MILVTGAKMGFLLADDKRYLQGEPYWSQPFLARVKRLACIWMQEAPERKSSYL